MSYQYAVKTISFNRAESHELMDAEQKYITSTRKTICFLIPFFADEATSQNEHYLRCKQYMRCNMEIELILMHYHKDQKPPIYYFSPLTMEERKTGDRGRGLTERTLCIQYRHRPIPNVPFDAEPGGIWIVDEECDLPCILYILQESQKTSKRPQKIIFFIHRSNERLIEILNH